MVGLLWFQAGVGTNAAKCGSKREATASVAGRSGQHFRSHLSAASQRKHEAGVPVRDHLEDVAR